MSVGSCCLNPLLFIVERKKRLEADLLSSEIACDEVDFEIQPEAFAVFVSIRESDGADIGGISGGEQIVVDDMFHDGFFFVQLEIEHCVSESDVGEIVFLREADISFVEDFEDDEMADQVGLFEFFAVDFDAGSADEGLAGGVDGLGDLAGADLFSGG